MVARVWRHSWQMSKTLHHTSIGLRRTSCFIFVPVSADQQVSCSGVWSLSPDVTLAELNRLLRKRFGTSDQAERFRRMCARRRKLGEELQQLYNELRHLMSLAYPRTSSNHTSTVGHDAFPEALGDPSLRVCILDKSPTNMEEVLHHALTLEALDRSRDVELKAMADRADHTDK